MKKIRNVMFSLIALLSLLVVSGCLDLREDVTTIEPQYTVTFMTTSGDMISEVTNYVGVEIREYQIPQVPVLAGHSGKWVLEGSTEEVDFSQISTDITVYAAYEVEKYVVTFFDLDGNPYLDTEDWKNNQEVEYGQAAVAPTVSLEGYDLSWSVAFDFVTSSLEVYLVKEIQSYDVVFVDWNDEVLASQVVEYQGNPTLPENPTREATAQYTYTFAGWDVNGDGEVDETPFVITGETKIQAVYTATVNQYTVLFQNYDGTTVQNTKVEYGTLPTLPEDPTREATAQYTYTFAGWDVNGDGEVDELVAVTGDITIVAVYTATVNQYTVTFVDWDETVLKEETVDYGTAATSPENPNRTGYTFAEWNKAFDNIVEDTTVQATYTINQYTYRFVNEDGTVLKEETVDYGTEIVAPTETPSKESTVQYHYIFAGWDKEFATMPAEDLEVKAQYTEELRKYEATFIDEDGTELLVTETYYGSNATLPDPLPSKVGYSFVGWLVNDAEEPVMNVQVLGETRAVASYSINTYTVIGRIVFDLGDGNTANLDKEVARGYYGQTGIDIKAAIQSISWEREGYNLVGWKQENGEVISLEDLSNFTMPAENTILYPQYEVKTFTVKFVDHDNSVLKEEVVEWGKDAVAPEDPTREDTAEWKYSFLTWSKAYTNVRENIETTAVYDKVKQQYTVTFLDENNEVLGTSTVDYGTAAVEPEIDRVGYTWTWDASFDNVTEDMTVQATFVKKVYTITVYIGEMYYTYTRYYGEEFDPIQEIPLGGGTIVLTGNLKVRESSGTLSSNYYQGKYVVEDVDSVSFDAEYQIVQK